MIRSSSMSTMLSLTKLPHTLNLIIELVLIIWYNLKLFKYENLIIRKDVYRISSFILVRLFQ